MGLPLTSNKILSDSFPRISVADLKQFPIRRIAFTTPADERERLAGEGQNPGGGGGLDRGLRPAPSALSPHQLAAEPERSDVVHDLLAHLAEQMIDLNKQRQKLERALDPFKWLDRGATCEPFTKVFAEEIKYGELVGDPDLGAVRHDVEQLRLVPTAGGYELQAYLKYRDPATDWSKALYDDDDKIVRAWVPVYRFDMDATKAQFYTHALPVLDQFTAYKKFPGGKTKTALQKLHAGRLPIIGSASHLRGATHLGGALDLTPLEELTAELALARGAHYAHGRPHRPDCLQALRADGGGNWDCGGWWVKSASHLAGATHLTGQHAAWRISSSQLFRTPCATHFRARKSVPESHILSSHPMP